MKEKEMIAGIDVSKLTLDICLLINADEKYYKVSNTTKSIKTFFVKLLKQNPGLRLIICMENTGYYNWPSYNAFKGMPLDLFVVNGLHLKRSMGMVRGKTDIIDAKRIANFIATHKSDLKPYLIPRKEIRTIQALLAQRNRLVETKKKLSVPTSELSFVADKELLKKIKKSSEKVINEIEYQILSVEKELHSLIEEDAELKQKYEYITSVQGVGKVLAWTMLVKTNEFKTINEPRKLACYAGVVPFEYQSGSSVYKKPRVSFMADKTLKKLLHLSAMRAIQLKGDLQNYYQRKVNEGKNKMLVLNAVRNKIVARICAMVNKQRKYEINLLLS
jgi:transposase